MCIKWQCYSFPETGFHPEFGTVKGMEEGNRICIHVNNMDLGNSNKIDIPFNKKTLLIKKEVSCAISVT